MKKLTLIVLGLISPFLCLAQSQQDFYDFYNIFVISGIIGFVVLIVFFVVFFVMAKALQNISKNTKTIRGLFEANYEGEYLICPTCDG